VSSLALQLDISIPSPIQRITPSWKNADDHSIYIKRDDLIHPIISGNKWRKLSFILGQLIDNQVKNIGSFGGGHSNHIHALAFCCQRLGIGFHAFIRGNYSNNETSMLTDIANWNTRISYLSKMDYKKRVQVNFTDQLTRTHGLDYIIPEGGSEAGCLSGMQQLLNEIEQPFDTMLLPVASGGTLAGLAIHASQVKQLTGIAVLKGQGYLEELVTTLIGNASVVTPYSINHAHHDGGYAKASPQLRAFCSQASAELNIPFEPVYSGKVLFALKHMLAQQRFPANSRILVLHTGGLHSSSTSFL